MEFLSPFRISIFILTALAFINLLKKGTIKKGNYLVFIFAIAISSIISVLVSINNDWAKSIFLNDMFGVVFMFIIVNYLEKDDLDKMFLAIVYSQIGTILISVYTLIQYYFFGVIIKNISIFGVLSAALDDEFVSRATIWGVPRLSLPYPTPPHLSIVMIIAILILVLRPNLFSRRIKYILIAAFSAILVLTFSRTAIVALLIALVLLIFIKATNIKIRLSKLLLALILSSIIILIGVSFIEDNVLLVKFLSRFTISIDEIFQDRHLLVPLDGILIWISNIKYFIFGIGAGSSLYMDGAHTYLPPHFLNSLITLIVDRGLLGLIIAIEFTRLFLKSVFTIVYNEMKSVSSSLAFVYVNIYISFFFYESRQNILIWIIISMLYLYNNNSSSVRRRYT